MALKTEVSLKLPSRENLVCVDCKIDPFNTRDPIVKSVYHYQILTCRLIIHTVRNCIASPSIQKAHNKIYVIVSKQFFNTGRLQKHLHDLRIEFDLSETVDEKIYQTCLKYTFAFKLAPHWNLIARSCYLKGSDFLSLPSGIDAMTWNILFDTDGNSRLELSPTKVNLQPLSLESLPVAQNILENFKSNPNSTIVTIDLSLFNTSDVYVLPKLTRGKLVSVSKTIPSSCPFSTYQDLRRHWKNMYAFRLPKTDKDMLFYEVVFPMSKDQPFTYPEMCILSKLPEYLMCENKDDVSKRFIKDFAESIHSICGEVIKINNSSRQEKEYSRVITKRVNNYNTVDCYELSSNFFTPTEDKLNNNSLDYLSSIFSLNKTMNNFSSQEPRLTFQNQKKSQKRKKENKFEHFSLLPDFMLSRSGENDEKLLTLNNSWSEKKIPSFNEEIISYYDLPNKNANNSDDDDSDTNQNMFNDNKSVAIESFIDEYKQITENFKKNVDPKTIRSLENVSLDWKNLKKIRNHYKQQYSNSKISSSRNQPPQVTDIRVKNKLSITKQKCSKSNKNKTQDEDDFLNLNRFNSSNSVQDDFKTISMNMSPPSPEVVLNLEEKDEKMNYFKNSSTQKILSISNNDIVLNDKDSKNVLESKTYGPEKKLVFPINFQKTNEFENLVLKKSILSNVKDTQEPKLQAIEQDLNSCKQRWQIMKNRIVQETNDEKSQFSQNKKCTNLSHNTDSLQYNIVKEINEELFCSEDIIQNEHESLKVDCNTKNNCSFENILSQSSNESESGKYENYKQHYTEALTFDPANNYND
ncbi:uncharacterized protein C18orf63-like [Trichogramma pretiosum]|uniref:uncharacterized protein C18orf63-like n=1 Tax=Trichogramma pretiosum TaxID=7493 RepID=UPI000C71B1B4|nr:uncharacterized protein C18orf63-like [Trichogramma pretiosum]